MSVPPDPTRPEGPTVRFDPEYMGQSGRTLRTVPRDVWFMLAVAVAFLVVILGAALDATDRPEWELIREPSTGRTFQCHRYQDDLCVEVFP